MKPLRALVVAALAAALSITVVVAAPSANAAAGSLTQCVNGATTTTCDGGWTTGALTATNSEFHEDDVVPQRLVISGLTPSSTGHSVTILYDAKKNGFHGYDYLATWNKSVTGADACQSGAPALCTAAPSTRAIPSDTTHVPPSSGGSTDLTSDHELAQTDRQMTMYGAVVTGVSAPTHTTPTSASDTGSVTVTFTAGPTGSAILLWGTHLAVGTASVAPHNWGAALGASQVSGGSLATHADVLDGAPVGGNNTIQGKAIGVFPPASFSVSKVAGSSTSTPGAPVTYTTTVTNTGGTAGSTSFTDNYNDSASVSGALPAGCVDSTVGADKQFTCTTGSINPGSTQTFTYVLTMPTSFTGAPSGCANGGYPVVNTVTLGGGGTSSATVCVTAAAAFTITKTASSGTAAPGGPITYTVTVKNTGTAPGSTTFTDVATNGVAPTFTSSSPAGGTCTSALSCTTSTISAGASQVFTFAATMPSTFTGASTCANGYLVSNTATLAGGAGDTASVCVSAASSFTITKTASSPTSVPGGTITYTVTVKNTGSASGSTGFTDTASNGVTPTLTGTSPAGGTCTASLSCTTSSINAGASQSFTFSATMPSTFTGTPTCADGYQVTNTATLTGGAGATVPVCVSAGPAFAITKTVNKGTASPGDTVTYTVKVTNTGSAPGATSFTDNYNDNATAVLPLAAGCVDATVGTDKAFTCTTGSLAPGTTQTFTYDVKLPTSFTGSPGIGCELVPGAYPVTNLVTLANGGASAPATVCVNAAAAFSVKKTASSTTAAAGDTVSYTVKVTNFGTRPGSTSFQDDYPDTASAVLPLPPGCFDSSTTTNKTLTCTTGTLDPGTSQSFTYSLKMPASFSGTPSGCANGGYPVINSVAVVGGSSGDSATVCVTTSPGFDIHKTAASSTAQPGDPVSYTVKVTNNGTGPGVASFTDDYNDNATAVTPLPTGCVDSSTATNKKLTCTTGSLNPGLSQSFTYSLTMPTTFTGTPSGCANGGYPVVNSVTVNGGATDSATVCVDAQPKLTVSKSVTPGNPKPGDTVTYTVTVTNSGSAPGGTTVTDDYDNRLTPTVPVGCTNSAGVLTCTTGSILPGGHQDFVYTAMIPAAFSGPSECTVGGSDGYKISNTATISGSTKTVDFCVPASPAFSISKTVTPTSSVPGGTVHYTIIVTNSGDAGGSTGFVDNYDDRVTADLPTSQPAGGTCSRITSGDDVFSCTTGTIPAHGQQTFTYDAVLPATFTGSSGQQGCAPGTFAVTNIATLVSGGADAPAVVCVDAKPHFQVAKAATGDAVPGATISYTVTVTNDGAAPGATTVSDDYDNRLTPSVPAGCTNAAGVLTCTTGSLDPGTHQDFTYTAVLPATYTGDSGGGGCAAGSYPITNTASITSGEHGTAASRTVCVAAAPDLHLVKNVQKAVDPDSTVLTYTVDYTNTGPAEATHVVLTDPIPADTTFVSCTSGCTTSGSPATASWNIASVAPITGAGSVVLVVKVTGKQACSISNTAQIRAGTSAPVSSNTVTTAVTPPSDPTGANANGSGVGAQVLSAGLLNLLIGGNGDPIGYSHTNQTGPGGPVFDAHSVVSAKVPSNGTLVKVGVVNTSSASAVDGSPIAARQLSTADVANICLVPVGGVCTVEATALRAVAATTANGTTVGTTSAGSTIANLKIAGLATVDVNENTKITLNPLVFGPGSYVAINEHQSNTGLAGGKLFADMTTTMIHLKITGLLHLQAVEIIVGQAKAHSEFLKTFECNPNNNSVSGHAYVAGVNTGPLQTNLIQGFVGMGPKGGGSEQHLAAVAIPANGSLVTAKAADSSTVGTVTPTASDSFSVAEVAGDGAAPACVLRTSPTACVVTATAVRSEARSHADGSNGSVSSDAATTLANVKVLGIAVPINVAPNTVIDLPGIGFVVLNEQTCDGGGPAVNHTCSGYPHSGITVRAIHIVITVLGNVLGLQPAVQLVVSEAHADSTFY